MANNPYVNKVQTADGTTIIDITGTTAVASDVMQGKYFFAASGQLTLGTNQGGGGGGSVTQDQDGYIVLPSTGGGGGGATQHTIHLEFSDSTDTDINVYYDDSLIGTMITEYAPAGWTYNNKLISLAQLDNVTWYEPANIPLNTELVDFTKIKNDTGINHDTGEEMYNQWYSVTDFTPISSEMTFSFKCMYWGYLAFYDTDYTFISVRQVSTQTNATQDPNDSNTGIGTLNSNYIPSTAAYIRLPSLNNVEPVDDILSLIRTA